MYDENAKNAAQMLTAGQIGGPITRAMNPTLRENIDAKIQYHNDEIERLEQIKAKVPQLLDVNLRDLREAMNF